MRTIAKTSALFAGLLAVAAFATQANAQATRTWVSGVGDDANPCSRTAPCKTFAGAISKTAGGGEINVLDPGGFGGVTITKAITIRADYVEAGVLVSGTNAIIVAAGINDRIVLEGLDIEGLGTGLDGVRFSSGKEVHIVRCHIHQFNGNGVNMISSTSGAKLFVKDSHIVDNTTGINIQATSPVAVVSNTVIDANSTFGVVVNGANNVAHFVNSIISNSPNTMNVVNGASSISHGPSNVLLGPGAFSSSTPFN